MPLVGKNDRMTKKLAGVAITEGTKLGELRKAVARAFTFRCIFVAAFSRASSPFV